MSAHTPSDLVDAFFDEPGLLAVRCHAGHRSAAARFACRRQPDVRRGGCSKGCMGFLLSVGVMAGMVGVTAVVGGVDTVAPDPRIEIQAVSTTDGLGGSTWRASLAALADDLAPQRADLAPWQVRTLLEVTKRLAGRGDASGGWLQPRCDDGERRAFGQGQRLAALLATDVCGAGTALILDLPGPLSLAMAAGLAAVGDPVVAIDNLPHPRGVVPSAQTLAAAVYWRSVFQAGRPKRRALAPPVFVLEGQRLAAYANEADRFDNRSLARLPDVDGWKALGVRRILCLRERRASLAEADDLNDLLVALAGAGIEVRHLSLEAMAEVYEVEKSAAAAFPRWFQAHYGWDRPADLPIPTTIDADAAYRSVPRLAALPTALDGGSRREDEALTLLAAPFHPATSTRTGSGSNHSFHRSGGSWSRSHHSFSG